jgi:hypothetical protein
MAPNGSRSDQPHPLPSRGSAATADADHRLSRPSRWAIATARQLGPVVVDYFGLAMLPLEEAVSIGILEATVHLLDLQRALGVPPDVPSAGLEHTVGLLAKMTPPVDFIELATGRSEVELFPVLR